jgi:hypothetical protein
MPSGITGLLLQAIALTPRMASPLGGRTGGQAVLIGELAPQAIDQVNAKAFAEAYKDLAEM